jgi:NADH dehydrogenase FAD-containing subunit
MRQKTTPIDSWPHVVIVGGGFGGTHAAHALRHLPVRVTLIDRTNHSVFHPLLYQVATAALSSDEIAAPIRSLPRRQQNAIAPEYRHIDTHTARILLFEAGPRLLEAFPEQFARKAQAELQRKGVDWRSRTLRPAAYLMASATRRDLPSPASPEISTVWPWPPFATSIS